MTQNFLSTPCSSLPQELAVAIEAHRQTQLHEHDKFNTMFKHLQYVVKHEISYNYRKLISKEKIVLNHTRTPGTYFAHISGFIAVT